MDSNTVYNQDVNIKDLIFTILYKWRCIIAVGIILAVGLGGFKALMAYKSQNDAEARQEALEKYQSDVELYETNKTTYEREIENLLNDIEKQQEYLEGSVLMNMSPYDICEARADLFIRTDYEIMPGMVYQNADYTDTILQAYQSMMTSTAFLEDISRENKLTTQYLQELVSVERGNTLIGNTNASKLTNLLTIKIRHTSTKKAEEVLKSILTGVNKLQTQITGSIGTHTVSIVNESSGSTVDLDLAEHQKQESQRLTDLQNMLDEKEQGQKGLEEPQPLDSSVIVVLKKGIKYGVFGGVAGGFLSTFFIGIGFLLSEKIYSAKDLRGRFGLRIMGELPIPGAKRGNFIDRWLMRLEGRKCTLDIEKEYALIAANIQNNIGPVHSIMLAGNVAAEYGDIIKENLADYLKEVNIITGASILEDADTIRALPQCDAIILLEETSVSTFNMIEQELSVIKDLKKSIIGCILLEKF